MEYDKPYTYGVSVKIANWQDRMQAYPLDNPRPYKTGASHYRSFGEKDFVFVPKTTTQDLLEGGVRRKTEVRQGPRKQINFVSYPMNDFRFSKYHEYKETANEEPVKTSYQDVFKAPRPLIEKKDNCEEVVDPLINRIPKNDFEMLPSSTNKFMDDHLNQLSEGRKRINFLRQMRNSTGNFISLTK